MNKVLVVEDSLLICKIIQNMLQDEYDVYLENSGKDVVKTALDVMPDAILLSLVFDDLDGIEICKELKQNELLNEIPIVFITSTDDEMIINECFKNGAVDFIVKPFKKLNLLARIKCHTNNKLLNDKIKLYAKELEENLKAAEEFATKDSLTNLFNRRYMLQMLDLKFISEIKKKTKDYIFLVDIDDFKSVNDKYGHNMGDHVLRVISEIIQNFAGDNCLVSRWGGEEFLVVASNITSKDFKERCDQILKNVGNFGFNSFDETFKRTLTIGATLIDYTKTIEENIHDADIALYYGKNSGKNHVVFYDSTLSKEDI